MKLRCPPPQPGRVFEQLGPGQGDDEDGVVARPGDEALEEVDEAGVGPLEILDDEDGGAGRGDALEERPPGREQLAALEVRGTLEPEEGEDRRLDLALLFVRRDVGAQHGADLLAGGLGALALGDVGTAADHLAQRPERHALAVGRGAALVPAHGLHEPVDVLLELPGQAALADAGLAGDRDEAGATLAGGGVEEVLEERQLLVASDERRLQPLRATRPAPTGDDAEGLPGRLGSGLALERLLPHGVEGDRRARGEVGRLPDEDRSRLRHGLEARGGVDEIAGDHALPLCPDGHGGLPGQHAGARLDGALRGAQKRHRLDEVEGCAHGTLGVVLVGHRRAPDGHHGIADELLDRAAVALDALTGQLEVARQESRASPRDRGPGRRP